MPLRCTLFSAACSVHFAVSSVQCAIVFWSVQCVIVCFSVQCSSVAKLRNICWRVKPWQEKKDKGLFTSIYGQVLAMLQILDRLSIKAASSCYDCVPDVSSIQSFPPGLGSRLWRGGEGPLCGRQGCGLHRPLPQVGHAPHHLVYPRTFDSLPAPGTDLTLIN